MRINFAQRIGERARIFATLAVFASVIGLRSVADGADPPAAKSKKPTAVELPAAIMRNSTPGEVHRLTEHTGPVTGIALSRDGRYLASCSTDQTACVWELATLPAPLLLKSRSVALLCVTFAPDGQKLFAGSGPGEEDTHGIYFWDLPGGENRHNIINREELQTKIVIAPNGRWLATAHPAGRVAIRDFANLLNFRDCGPQDMTMSCHDLAFTPDSSGIAMGYSDSKIIMWDVQARRESAEENTAQQGVRSVAFHPAGALATGGIDGTIKTWTDWRADLKWGRGRGYAGHKGPVRTLAYSSDGKLLASGGEDTLIKLWETATGKLRQTLSGHTGPVNALLILPGDQYAVSASDDATVRFWRLATSGSSAKPSAKPPADEDAPARQHERAPQIAALQDGKISVPGAKQLAEAEKLLNDVYQNELAAARKPADKLKLAERMLDQGRLKEAEATERFTLLTMATRLAIDAGNPSIALAATDELVTHFESDVWKMEAETLTKLSAKVTKEKAELADAALDRAVQAAADNHFAEANQMLKVGVAAARVSKDAALARRGKELQVRLEHDEKCFKAYEVGLKTLATDSTDAKANMAVGLYLCMVRHDWGALTHLAKGSDDALKDLATNDLANPDTAASQAALADQWQTVGATMPESERQVCEASAAYWYSRALPELTGLAKLKAERALEKIGEVPENLRRSTR